MFSQRHTFRLAAILLSTQLFIGCAGPREQLDASDLSETSDTQTAFNDSAESLLDSGELGEGGTSQSTTLPTGTVSTSTAASCQANAGASFTPGFGNTNSFNDFGFGNTQQSQQTSTSSVSNTATSCLATGMTAQLAGGIGSGSYDMAATCMQVAQITLVGMKRGSTAPSIPARMAAGQAFMGCLQTLIERQYGAANWSGQARAGFGNAWNNAGTFGNYLGAFR